MMRKIAIVGVPGSGKTTLANKLGEMLNISVYHLDKIVWKKGNVYANKHEIIEKINEILEEPRWILEGSVKRPEILDIRFESADTIIFFDIPLVTVLCRQTKRFFKHFNRTRPDMGGGNIQRYPFTWRDFKNAWSYPTDMIYAKIESHKSSKTVIVIKNNEHIATLIEQIKSGT